MESTRFKTDWSKCCLCQQDTNEELKLPPKIYVIGQDGYGNITSNVPHFQAMRAMLILFDPASLNEGGGIDNYRTYTEKEQCKISPELSTCLTTQNWKGK